VSTPLEFLPFTCPSIDEDTLRAVNEVFRSGWLASGSRVVELEKRLSDYCGGRPVRLLTSATEALEIALRVLGIGPGDEVIVPALSFAATANVIARVGARPVFVDVELATRNLDLGSAERAVTDRTRALLPVHFAGHPVDLDALYDLARRRELRVVEDAAHAIGSAFRGQRIGSRGDLVCFSFHPNKNMTTIEGGAIAGGTPAELGLIEKHRYHGIERHPDGEMDVTLPGGKSNLSDVAAQVGLGQLARLDGFNARRRQLAGHYFARLESVEPALQLPPRGDEGHSWHMFAPLLPLPQLRISRAVFIEQMRARGIGVGIHYPAMHLFSYYRKLGYREGDLPSAERVGRETVTLPLFPAMTEADVDRVCGAVAEIFAEQRR
jgi:dTDP-4-amino-4,6-dideoxygalactose transaminase